MENLSNEEIELKKKIEELKKLNQFHIIQGEKTKAELDKQLSDLEIKLSSLKSEIIFFEDGKKDLINEIKRLKVIAEKLAEYELQIGKQKLEQINTI